MKLLKKEKYQRIRLKLNSSINLHSRQKKILSILNAKHDIATGKEISAKIGVSERTIRTDISQMNEILKPYEIEIISIHGKGYKLSIKERSVFLKLFSEKESVVTKEDRLRTFILRLLKEDDWLDIGILEDEMFVSHTTLEMDIKDIKRKISKQHPFLGVERKGNLIKFEDDERKRRDLLTRFYVENWDYDSKEGIVLSDNELGADEIKSIQQILKNRLMYSKAYMDDYSFIYLTLAIYVLHIRLESGRKISSDRQYVEGMELKIDNDIEIVLNLLNARWGHELDEAEYAYMSDIKEQLVFLSKRTYSKNYVLSKTDISCHRIVDEILDELNDEYGIDFTTDDKLFVDLTRHVQAIESGIIATSIQNHVLGDALRKRHSFLGDIAHRLSMKISEKCNVELGIEEEDFILPFLILAEENLYKKKRGKGIPTAVISHYNESMTHYLMSHLERNYGDVLDLKGPYAIHAKDMIDRDKTMLVLTTVQMKSFESFFKVPILTVSPLMESADKRGIDLYLASLKHNFLYQIPERKMEEYFPKNLRYEIKEKSNLISILNDMNKKFQSELGITIEKIDLEKDYYCSLSNGFFFCYQISNKVSKTVVSVADLGKETSCKYVRNVKKVMYMIMPPKERNTLGWFYYIATALSRRSDEFAKVLEGESLEELSINVTKGELFPPMNGNT